MDVLIRKADAAVIEYWLSPPKRIAHPDKPGGALVSGDIQSPFDLGDYVIVTASVTGYTPFDPETENRTGPVFTVDPQTFATGAAYTVTAKTQAELDAQQLDADRSVLRNSEAAVFVLITLIDALLANATITVNDFDAVARAAYQQLKPIADRVKAAS